MGAALSHTRRYGVAIDKGVLSLPEPRRVRDREHPCLVCDWQPPDAHQLRFTENRHSDARSAMSSPCLCAAGTSARFTATATKPGGGMRSESIPRVTARVLWLETHPLPKARGKRRSKAQSLESTSAAVSHAET